MTARSALTAFHSASMPNGGRQTAMIRRTRAVHRFAFSVTKNQAVTPRERLESAPNRLPHAFLVSIDSCRAGPHANRTVVARWPAMTGRWTESHSLRALALRSSGNRIAKRNPVARAVDLSAFKHGGKTSASEDHGAGNNRAWRPDLLPFGTGDEFVDADGDAALRDTPRLSFLLCTTNPQILRGPR